MKNNLFFSGLIALIISLSSIGVFSRYNNAEKTVKIEHINSVPGQPAVYSLDEKGQPIPLDFNETAEKVLDGVVHIFSTQSYT